MSHSEKFNRKMKLLQDIEGPTEPAWWLPGPAQLLAMLLLAVGVAGWLLYRRRRRRHYWRRLAATELARIEKRYRRHGDGLVAARELSAWLRRVSLLAFPGQAPAGLVGDAWLRFLDRQHAPGGFRDGAGRVFGDEIYRRDAAPEFEALAALCAGWLESVAPALGRLESP